MSTVPAPPTVGELSVLFEGELGANQSAKSRESYHHKRFHGWKCLRTELAAERLPVIPSGLFPLPLGRELLIVFRGRWSILEKLVLFVFG